MKYFNSAFATSFTFMSLALFTQNENKNIRNTQTHSHAENCNLWWWFSQRVKPIQNHITAVTTLWRYDSSTPHPIIYLICPKRLIACNRTKLKRFFNVAFGFFFFLCRYIFCCCCSCNPKFIGLIWLNAEQKNCKYSVEIYWNETQNCHRLYNIRNPVFSISHKM